MRRRDCILSVGKSSRSSVQIETHEGRGVLITVGCVFMSEAGVDNEVG